MSESRKILLEKLHLAVTSSPNIFNEACRKSKKHWNSKSLDIAARSSRSFDVFHLLDLYPRDFVNQMADTFFRIPKIDKDNIVNMQLSSLMDQQNMEKWASEIVNYACVTLLEKDGSLNQAILQYLKFEDISACYQRNQIANIVTSYINVVLSANIFIKINLAKLNPFERMFHKLFKDEHAKIKPVLTQDEFVKFGFVSKITSKLVKQEIAKNFSVGRHNEIEVQAEAFSDLIMADFKQEIIANKHQELSAQVEANIIHKDDKLIFWLEVLLQVIPK